MTAATKIPQIPSVPRGIDPDLNRFLSAVKELLEVGESRRGYSLDRYVKARDLPAGLFVSADGVIHAGVLAINELIVGDNLTIKENSIYMERHIVNGTAIVKEDDSITRLVDRTLDYIVNGATYGRILLTDISSGHIKLASCIASDSSVHVNITNIGTGQITLVKASGSVDLNMDHISPGVTYDRVRATYLDSGKIVMVNDTALGKDINRFADPNYLTSGAFKMGSLYQVGEILTIESGTIQINAVNRFIINASKNMVVKEGADIVLQPAEGNTSRMLWNTGGYNLNIGADYAANTLGVWSSSVNTGSFMVGWIPGDTGGGFVGTIRRLAAIRSYAYTVWSASQLNASGESLIEATNGTVHLAATVGVKLDYNGTNKVILAGTSMYVDAGTVDLGIGGAFRDGAFSRNVGIGGTLSVTAAITGGSLSAGSITGSGFLFSSTGNVGSPAIPAQYVYIGSRLRFPAYTAPLDFLNCIASGTVGAQVGYISVEVDGMARRIPIHAAS